ncbi:MAG: RNA-binding S4 domain-containing protein [Pyrinomonadaceae bacterium]
MRLDLFLKASRLCSGRTVAQKFCEAGLVSINGTRAKSAHIVNCGDTIIIRRGNKLTTIRVIAIPVTRQVSRKDASTLYQVTSEESLDLAEF